MNTVFTGHYTTLQRHVKEVANSRQEAFMPLEFDPGEEAQVDWHEGYVIDNGVERKVNCFLHEALFSKAPFVYPCLDKTHRINVPQIPLPEPI